MYDKDITAKHVAAEVAFTDHLSGGQRFLGIYHSVSEVNAFIAYMATLLDDETGELRRPLNTKEQQWILNEQVLCSLDFHYWASRFARIVTDKGVLMPFIPNVAQRMVINVWAEMEAKGWAIMMIQLKARQLGVSTLTEIAALHRFLFYPDIKGVVASNDDEKSALMARMMEACYEEQPWWLVPTRTTIKIGKAQGWKNNSFVTVQSGNQTSGIARGNTPQVSHISELADFHDPGELIDSSLLHAVHPHAGTFLVLESTAKGFDNWWHDKWYSSVRNWQKGTARLCPIFLPWFVGTDKYPTDTWLRMHPIPDGWQPNEKTEKHAEKAALYVQSNPRLQAVYGDHWTMPRRQQWFYEVSYDEAKDEKRLPAFLSEMPSDPDEAFQSTNVAAVELEALIPHRDRAMSRPPVVVLGIKGDPDELPMRHQPSRRSFDTTSKYAAIRLKTFLGRTISEYSLHPLKFRGYDEDFEKRLYVWEWPQNEEEYGLGIDTADGVGQDRTVCTVVKRASIWHPWVQVAEFASSYMNAYDFWPIVQAIALLYTVRVNGDIRQPKIVVECKGNGEAVQHELKKRGWNKFHPWLRYDSKKTIPSKAHKIGVLTTGWFRSLMMDKILKVFNDQEIDIGSPWLVSEFQRLERDEMKQQFRADHGAHDDRVMATAMVIFSMDILGVRPKERRRVEAEVADNEEDEATYTDVHAGDSEAVMAGTFTYQSLKAKPKTVRL